MTPTAALKTEFARVYGHRPTPSDLYRLLETRTHGQALSDLQAKPDHVPLTEAQLSALCERF